MLPASAGSSQSAVNAAGLTKGKGRTTAGFTPNVALQGKCSVPHSFSSEPPVFLQQLAALKKNADLEVESGSTFC